MKTKPILLLCFAVFSCMNILSAQTSFKITGGIQYSSQTTSFLSEYQAVPTFHTDLRLALFGNKKFQLDIGLGLDQKGYLLHQIPNFGGGPGLLPNADQIKARGIDIAGIVQFNFYLQTPSQGMYIYPAVRLGSTVQTYINGIDYRDGEIVGEQILRMPPSYFNLNPGLRVGLGYALKLGTKGIFAEIFHDQNISQSSLRFGRGNPYSFGLLLGLRL